MNAIVGLFGLAIFVICVIGAEMMMEVMVNVTNDLIYCILFSHLHPIFKFPLFFILAIVQLFYFVLGSMRTVVHYLDLCAPILRVTSKLFLVCWLVSSFFKICFIYFCSSPVSTNILSNLTIDGCCDILRWRIQYFPAETS